MLVERGAFAEAEPLRHRGLEARERQLGPEHRFTLIAVNDLAACAVPPGEVQRGAADVLCCSHRGGWMVLHFVLGKVGKIAGKTTTTFSDHLRICHLFCRSAMMYEHEHVNFTQIISNHLKSRHVWTCQNMDMSKFSKRCLQRTDAALQVSV